MKEKGGVYRSCLVCGCQIYVYPGQLRAERSGKKSKRSYCSTKCAGKARVGKNNHNWKPMVELVCSVCGKSFLRHPSHAKVKTPYCSNECRLVGGSANRRTCKTCGGIITGSGKLYCSVKCYGIAVSSGVHPRKEQGKYGPQGVHLLRESFLCTWLYRE